MLRRQQPDSPQPEWVPEGWEEPPDGPIRESSDYDDHDVRVWRAIGRRLYLGRKRLQISKREAARRAGISEALWRQLEDGGKEVNGKTVLPNPRPDNLLAATRAVGLDPTPIFQALDQDLPEATLQDIIEDRLARKISQLNDRDRQLVEELIDRLIGPTPAGWLPQPSRSEDTRLT